jgi:hypothetical protein
MAWVRFSAGERDFSLLQSVQTGSGAHPASCAMVSRALSMVVNPLGRETDHSPSTSVEVKNGRAIPPLPLMSS